jgi:hypothetical protein
LARARVAVAEAAAGLLRAGRRAVVALPRSVADLPASSSASAAGAGRFRGGPLAARRSLLS